MAARIIENHAVKKGMREKEEGPALTEICLHGVGLQKPRNIIVTPGAFRLPTGGKVSITSLW